MRFQLLAIAACAALVPLAPASAAPESIAGRWKTDDGRALVEFGRCGEAICGRIVRLLAPEPPGGARDAENPKAALRSRKIDGLRIFWNLEPDGAKWSGEGYSPEDGRYFNAEVSRSGNRLRIKGCVMLFCRTVTWTPA